MKVYRSDAGVYVEFNNQWHALDLADWDEWFAQDHLYDITLGLLAGSDGQAAPAVEWLAPIGTQEVWACGVTYFQSRTARMEESEDAGGGSFYDRVYSAERPELFFKSTAARVIGPGGEVRIRRDSTWDVPEPELTLALSASGKVNGYTIGNDMSSRSIEGENPLYLPQAKTYDGSAALGPCLALLPEPLAATTRIAMQIFRGDDEVFSGESSVDQIKRGFDELAGFLFREMSFPCGAYLMTGTGVVPGSGFTLEPADRIDITIDGMGCLTNTVASR